MGCRVKTSAGWTLIEIATGAESWAYFEDTGVGVERSVG